ncbi:hypothetical protein LAZ67_X003873 [Cordylochernes scorpioides]|uniref:Uncharacterized protein n=1 Tax=Cordylochernes scorpioides TaxID=51811 RepID=A0ABY6LXR3_9ARAC|nr:hypothetical protein LAZ67_X003873 [Cordylochernes scorpioides]
MMRAKARYYGLQPMRPICYPHDFNESKWNNKWGWFKEKCLYEEFADNISSMDCHLGYNSFSYPWRYIPDRNSINVVINVKPGRRNGVMYFQTNPGSVWSTMMAAAVFGAILEKAHCQPAFDIVILAHHQARCKEKSLRVPGQGCTQGEASESTYSLQSSLKSSAPCEVSHYPEPMRPICYPHDFNESKWNNKWGWFKEKCLYEEFADNISSMDCHLGYNSFSYPWRYIPDRNSINVVINVKPGRRNGVMYFQTNPGSVWSTMMAAAVFGAILEKAHCQPAFDIVLLAHHQARW